MHTNEITACIINSAIIVHKELGPGLLESVYKPCLALELADQGLHVQTEVNWPVVYRDREIAEIGFRLDLLVENRVVVELKSVERVRPVHQKQLLTYLKLTNKPLGLLINFNENLLKDGLTRIVNNL
jgi:GxxExxY protein